MTVATGRLPRPRVGFVPILDVARGTAAGYQACALGGLALPEDGEEDHELAGVGPLDPDDECTTAAALLAAALRAVPTLPTNTFLSLPVAATVAASAPVRATLGAFGDLRGLVLDVVGFTGSTPVGDLEYVLAQYRDAGALVAVGGTQASQPELSSIVRLKPAILRLGRDWTRDVDRSDAKRSAVEVIGSLSARLDAWILAEGVATTAELRALAALDVPLAQGPVVGEAREFWPGVSPLARAALPTDHRGHGGVLRTLLQPAYTTTDALAAAAVLPEASGFDVVVVVDEHRRPTSVLEPSSATAWEVRDVLTVNVGTSVSDAVARAMTRPRASRFAPLACTDDAGRFLGILRLETLMTHLAQGTA